MGWVEAVKAKASEAAKAPEVVALVGARAVQTEAVERAAAVRAVVMVAVVAVAEGAAKAARGTAAATVAARAEVSMGEGVVNEVVEEVNTGVSSEATEVQAAAQEVVMVGVRVA